MTLYNILQKPIVPIRTKDMRSLQYWRERIFFILSMVSLYLGTVVYILSIYFAVRSDLTHVVILDTFVYVVLLIVFTVRRIPFVIRVNLFLVIIYLLGTGLLITVGKFGAGNPWLFSFPILTAILLHHRKAIIALAINIVTLVGLFFLIDVLPEHLLLTTYGEEEFLVTFINFIGVNVIVTISLLILIRGLSNSLQNERNVTRRLRKEKRRLAGMKQKAEESERLKSAFLANISHEIRTPLNAIMGFIDLMNESKFTKEELKTFSKIVNDESRILLNLINDIIDISIIETGQLKIKTTTIDLKELVDRVCRFGKHYIKQKEKDDLKLECDYEQAGVLSIRTDPARLEQVLRNLVQNAIKYTNEGKVVVGYRLTENSEHVIFYVEDTGIGIPEDKREYIFKHFTQLENTQNPQEGTGLGLAIAKSLTELLGGELDFESDKNGTSFYLKLPRK